MFALLRLLLIHSTKSHISAINFIPYFYNQIFPNDSIMFTKNPLLRLLKFDIILNLVLFITCLILNLGTERHESDWSGLGDPGSYLYQAKFSLFDIHMYFPYKSAPGFSPRAFTTSLFYHFTGGNWNTIVNMQFCIHTISLFFLAYAISLFISKNWVKCLSIISIYLLGSWWNLLGWSTLLLSESLSISFMFLWIATLLILLKKRSTISLIVHLLTMLLFSFTHDNWCYVLPVFYGLLLLFSKISREKFTKIALVCFCSSMLFFGIQQVSIRIGERTELPLTNSIIIRVFPNDEHYKWFVDNGMPEMDTLRKKFSGFDSKNVEKISLLYQFYVSDSMHHVLYKWIKESGQSTYIKFLLTHSSYFFLQEETHEQLNRIFVNDLNYINPPRGYTQYLHPLFPIFSIWGLLIICVGVLILFIREKELIFFIPLCLCFMFFVNIILMYNADAMEDERHFFLTLAQIQLLSFMGLAMLLDNINFVEIARKLRFATLLKKNV